MDAAFAPLLRTALSHHRPALVDALLASIARSAPPTTSPLVRGFAPSEMSQFLHAMESIVSEALEGEPRGPVRQNVVDAMLPALRDAGLSLREATSWTALYFVHVAALCLPDVPRAARDAARNFLGDFARSYFEDLCATWQP